jgi:hypothetical protein
MSAAIEKAKHTPGPWQAIDWQCHAPTTIIARIGHANVVVAECSGHGRHTDESLADARLIASAPEMLEALESVRNELIGLSAYLLTCDTTVIVKNLETTVASLERKNELVNAAIRKARGEV